MIRVRLDANAFTSGAQEVTGQMQKMEGQAEKTGGVFGNMSDELQGAFAGASIAAVIGMVGQLGAAGREAKVAESSFMAMAGQIGDAKSIMDGLVGAGQGLIDDTDLYKAGALALSSQAITTAGDLNTLVTDGVKLGQAFKQDAAGGVDLLSQSIEKMSTRGLAQLGISIPATKAEIDKLTASGLDLQSAFRQAALDQASMAADRLGTVAYSATERLNVMLGDVRDTLGEIVANGIEAGAQIVALPGLLLQQQQQAASAKQSADLAGYGRGTVAAQTIDQDFKDKLGADFVSKFMIETLQNVNENPDVANQAHLTGKQIGDYVAEGYAELGNSTVYSINDMLFDGENLPAAQATAKQYIQGLVTYAFDQNREIMSASATATQQQQALMAAVGATASTYGRSAPMASQLPGALANGMTASEQRLNNVLGGAQTRGGITFITPEQFNLAGQLETKFSSIYTYASELHDNGIISDNAFGALKDANTEMQGLVSKSEKYRDNFDKVATDLNTMFNVGNGGLGGQIEDRVAAAMKAAGMSDKQIADYQSGADMTNGRNTPLNAGFNSGVVNQISDLARRNGSTAGVVATQRAQELLNTLMQTGASNDQMLQAFSQPLFGGPQFGPTSKGGKGSPSNWLGAATNLAGGGDGFGQTGKPLDFSQSATDAQAIATLMGQTQTTIDTIKGSTDEWTGYTDEVQKLLATVSVTDLPAAVLAAQDFYAKVDASRSSAQDIQSAFKDLTSKIQVVNIQFKATAPSWVTQLLNVADVVRTNAGTTPGVG